MNVPYELEHYQFLLKAAISIKISNLLIGFCSFDLSCPILEKENVIENLSIALSCVIK